MFLHIGEFKSGTSYLQTILDRNRENLARHGILVPGRSRADQVLAVHDVMGTRPHGRKRAGTDGAWQKLVAEIAAASNTLGTPNSPAAAVISTEFLSLASPEAIARIVTSLAPARVRVILAVRDVARTVPSQWQEAIKAWQTWSWPDYLAAVTAHHPHGDAAAAAAAPADEAARRFYEQHDAASILARWAQDVSADNVTVVTLPRPGADPGELWRRFAQVLGLDPAAADTDAADGGNPSLGAASAELVRDVNAITRAREQHAGVTARSVDHLVREVLANTILAPRRSCEPPLRLPDEHLPWARGFARRQINAVRELGVQVVGDLAELMPAGPVSTDDPVSTARPANTARPESCRSTGSTGSATDPGETTASGPANNADPPGAVAVDERYDAALDAIVGLLQHVTATEEQLTGARRGLERLRHGSR